MLRHICANVITAVSLIFQHWAITIRGSNGWLVNSTTPCRMEECDSRPECFEPAKNTPGNRTCTATWANLVSKNRLKKPSRCRQKHLATSPLQVFSIKSDSAAKSTFWQQDTRRILFGQKVLEILKSCEHVHQEGSVSRIQTWQQCTLQIPAQMCISWSMTCSCWKAFWVCSWSHPLTF